MQVTKRSTVSAVITTYNRASLVPRAIDSILSQTRPVDELIVVDDGSTDDTRAVVSAYGPPVHYVYQENRGLASARNRGIREARFEWVAFLDDDDEWLPEKIERQIGAVEEHTEAAACYTGIWCALANGEEICHASVRAEALWPNIRLSTPFPPSTLMARRKALEEVGGFLEGLRYAEDWHLIVRLASRFTFAAVSESLVRMHEQPSSLSQRTDDMLRTELSIAETMLVGLDGFPRYVWKMRVLSAIYYRAAIGKRTSAKCGMKYVLRSLLYWPAPSFRPQRYWTLILELRDCLKGVFHSPSGQHS
jgi:glycosyltransferase involved in cell wall biosynthesis